MKLPGWCTECHKVKQVRVTAQAVAKMAAAGANPGIAYGICDSCQEKQDQQRRTRNG